MIKRMKSRDWLHIAALLMVAAGIYNLVGNGGLVVIGIYIGLFAAVAAGIYACSALAIIWHALYPLIREQFKREWRW